MKSALERHTAGRDLPVVQERAREFAAASVSANTKRADEGAQAWLAGRPLDDATQWFTPLRTSEEVRADILPLEKDIQGLLGKIVGGGAL